MALTELGGHLTLPDLCQRVAVLIRSITGFDRAMVYRFLEDDTGCVVAEHKSEDVAPYLGLRYPASDNTGPGTAALLAENAPSEGGCKGTGCEPPAFGQLVHWLGVGCDPLRASRDVSSACGVSPQYGRGGIHADTHREGRQTMGPHYSTARKPELLRSRCA
jgi:hypothetical protein